MDDYPKSPWDDYWKQQRSGAPVAAPAPSVAAPQQEIPPAAAPTTIDPAWDATKDWLYKTFTRKGQFEQAAEDAQQPQVEMPSWDIDWGELLRKGGEYARTAATFIPGMGGIAVSPEKVREMAGYGKEPPPQGAGPAPVATPGTPAPQLPPNALRPPENLPPSQTWQPANAAPAVKPKTPEEIQAEDIARKQALIEQLFPRREFVEDGAQKKLDDFAAGEMERTKLLAQLAIAGGLMSSAGKRWEGMGRGFMNAAQIYDQGFTRYQNALEDAVGKAQKRADVMYGDELDRAKMVLELYSSDSKAGTKGDGKQREQILEYFQKTKPEADEFGITDNDKYGNWVRRYEYYLQTGIFIPDNAEDVRNKK